MLSKYGCMDVWMSNSIQISQLYIQNILYVSDLAYMEDMEDTSYPLDLSYLDYLQDQAYTVKPLYTDAAVFEKKYRYIKISVYTDMSLIYHNTIGIEEIYRYMTISVYKLSVYRGQTVYTDVHQ